MIQMKIGVLAFCFDFLSDTIPCYSERRVWGCSLLVASYYQGLINSEVSLHDWGLTAKGLTNWKTEKRWLGNKRRRFIRS